MVKIFVVGCGRSGTHWLGQSLENSGFSSSGETHLKMASDAVIYYDSKAFQTLIKTIDESKHQMHKLHPLLWKVEELHKIFPDALFIGISREVDATVKSMLKHNGVRQWCESTYTSVPFPSLFLGATTKTAYEKLTVKERCAARVHAHANELDRLEHVMPATHFLRVHYEQLEAETPRLCAFLGRPFLLEPRK